jgi:hypothetical protein
LDVVYDRFYYGGGKIIAGLFSGPGGPYLIWEGLNEYEEHLNETGSNDNKPF